MDFSSDKPIFDLYPALDLRQGQVVRLVQGDLQRQTVYDSSPESAAQRWLAGGARWLHVVNLDGAFDQPDQPNQSALADIVRLAQAAGVRVQFGGGLRTAQSIARALDLGVSRVVLGTVAVEHPALVREAVQCFGAPAVAVALDAQAGVIQTRGWQQSGGVGAAELAQHLVREGVRTFIYTDISRDGLAVGVNLTVCAALQAALSAQAQMPAALQVIASGGVHSLADLCAARQAGLAGVIIGRALYQGAFTLEDALRC